MFVLFHTHNYLFVCICHRHVYICLMTIKLFDLNKTDRYDITEILLKLALNTITLTLTRLSNMLYKGQEVIFSFWSTTL
jgi:hypothetical protein